MAHYKATQTSNRNGTDNYRGTDNFMSRTNNEQLMEHFGHEIEIGYYGKRACPRSVTIECMDCNEILLEPFPETDKSAKSLALPLKRGTGKQTHTGDLRNGTDNYGGTDNYDKHKINDGRGI